MDSSVIVEIFSVLDTDILSNIIVRMTIRLLQRMP